MKIGAERKNVNPVALSYLEKHFFSGNFINVLRTHFLYESSFKAKLRAEKRLLYEKCASKMLMKSTINYIILLYIILIIVPLRHAIHRQCQLCHLPTNRRAGWGGSRPLRSYRFPCTTSASVRQNLRRNRLASNWNRFNKESKIVIEN